MKNLRINITHISSDGLLKQKVLTSVYDAWFDELYKLRDVGVFPAVRIQYAQHMEYNVLRLAQPKLVVARIKVATTDLYISYEDFQPAVLQDSFAFILLAKAFPKAKRTEWDNLFSKTKYISEFWQKATQHPRLGREEDLLLCAQTLPTPKLPPGVTKLQYFRWLSLISQ